ncbi:MAG: class I tRNA ligase family protein [Betaproteobacteria bacterium]|nr:class I tRNA ligase family protein [Betaproteobacteria bacterium]
MSLIAPSADATRRSSATTALPYANGPFHVGHIAAIIQADVWNWLRKRVCGVNGRTSSAPAYARRADHLSRPRAEGVTPRGARRPDRG